MQVLLVTPLSRGGMVHYASQLANALSECVDVTQVVSEGADRSLWNDTVTLEPIAFPGSALEIMTFSYRSLPRLYRLILKADVVHVTARHVTEFLYYPALLRKPFVFTNHDVYQHDGTDFYHLTELLNRIIISLADRVAVHGEYNRNQFYRKYGTAEGIVSIPHGEYSFFRTYCESSIQYRPEFLFFGRIRKYKGIETLLAAEQRLDRSDYELVIAGSGELDDAVQDRENVQVINEFVTNEKVCELFSRCRAVVLPYSQATQSGIVPIAYAFRKPVIATNVGGLPEVVIDGETGLLVEPNDPVAFANGMDKLLDDVEKAKRFGEAGQIFSKNHLNWDDISGTLLSEYDVIL